MAGKARPRWPLSAAQQKLAADNLPLAKFLARHYARLHCARRADYFSAAQEALVDAALFYDPTRGLTFGAYAGIRIKSALLNELRLRTTRIKPKFLLSEPGVSASPSRRIEAKEISDRVAVYCTARERDVIHGVYLCGKRPHEVAAELGISRQRVQQIEVVALRRMRKKLRYAETMCNLTAARRILDRREKLLAY